MRPPGLELIDGSAGLSRSLTSHHYDVTIQTEAEVEAV